MNVPGSERAREQKGPRAKVPGSELARVLLADSLLGANWHKSEKALNLKYRHILTRLDLVDLLLLLLLQPFYCPFSGTTQVSRCQKRTSGVHGASARED